MPMPIAMPAQHQRLVSYRLQPTRLRQMHFQSVTTMIQR
jgi:hypothetical protein